MRPPHTLPLLGLIALAGCHSPPSEMIREGEHITVTSREGVELCGGSLDFLDAYVAHVHVYWGAAISSNPFELELRSEGIEGIRGRALQGRSWAGAEGAVLHELNHLVTQSTDGTSAPSLSEGIATALSPSDPAGMWGPGSGPPEDFAFVPYSELDFSIYQPSAQLVRFLVQRYGIETVRQAYVLAEANDTAEEIEAAYVSAFGDEIYDAFDEFEASPQCGLRAWECEPSLHPTLELPVDIVSPEDCTRDPEWAGAAGDLNEHWYPHRRFLLEVDEEMQIVTYAENARVARSTCGDVCPSYLDTPPGFDNVAATALSGAVYPRTLVPGIHTFHVLPLDPSLPFSARIEAAE